MYKCYMPRLSLSPDGTGTVPSFLPFGYWSSASHYTAGNKVVLSGVDETELIEGWE
jgi:hypothetical protein